VLAWLQETRQARIMQIRKMRRSEPFFLIARSNCFPFYPEIPISGSIAAKATRFLAADPAI
jgi:hypothetical protein